MAIIGIAGALLAGHRSPTRVGPAAFSRRQPFPQIRKLIFVEAGLIGLLANLAGLALGVGALAAADLCHQQAIVWMDHPACTGRLPLLLAALTVIFLATLLSGFYPARVATQLNPIEVVHEE